jgi:hypothetical protein
MRELIKNHDVSGVGFNIFYAESRCEEEAFGNKIKDSKKVNLSFVIFTIKSQYDCVICAKTTTALQK